MIWLEARYPTTWAYDRDGTEIPPMDLANMRENEARSVEATCEACWHEPNASELVVFVLLIAATPLSLTYAAQVPHGVPASRRELLLVVAKAVPALTAPLAVTERPQVRRAGLARLSLS